MREVFLDGSHAVVIFLQNSGDISSILNTRLTQFRQERRITALFRFLSVFVFEGFCSIGLSDEGRNIRRRHHEVDGIGSSSSKLNGTRRDIAVKVCPSVTYSDVSLEHRAVKLNKSFSNDRDIFSLSTLDSHHSGKRASSSDPVASILVLKVLNAGHEARGTFTNEDSSVETDTVAVLRVKVARNSTTPFIAKVVALGLESSSYIVGLVTVCQLCL